MFTVLLGIPKLQSDEWDTCYGCILEQNTSCSCMRW